MKVFLSIRIGGDVFARREIEAPRTIDAVILALNGSAGDELRARRGAAIHIEARSASETIRCGREGGMSGEVRS